MNIAKCLKVNLLKGKQERTRSLNKFFSVTKEQEVNVIPAGRPERQDLNRKEPHKKGKIIRGPSLELPVMYDLTTDCVFYLVSDIH